MLRIYSSGGRNTAISISSPVVLQTSPRSRTLSSTCSNHNLQWRPSAALDEWVERPIHPLSLRQLFFFGRTLTRGRLISAANFVRAELPIRIAHRLREMQKLPYAVVTNPHLASVYELYFKAFENFRRIPVIRTVEQNNDFCKIISDHLNEYLSIVPKLVMGVLECQHLMAPDKMDNFANAMLRARISRRVIAEQHLALTETFNGPQDHTIYTSSENDFVGEILLRCNAREIVEATGKLARDLCRHESSVDRAMPAINIHGHVNATFPYVLSHLQYIIGELIRNSIQAVMEHHKAAPMPPPIDVHICEAPEQIVIRISDQGGGIPTDTLPYLWSFHKGPRSQSHLRNLGKIKTLAGTVEEIQMLESTSSSGQKKESSLSTLATRPSNVRLGIGLPMSRVYAEYWAGGLELQSLQGYGVDAFLRISKLGNQNERLASRASIDAV